MNANETKTKFEPELIEKAKAILDEIKHPIEQSDAIEELLESYDYDADDVVDLMSVLIP